MNSHRSPSASLCLLAATVAAGAFLTTIDTAEARRGFGAMFSAGRTAGSAGSAARATGRVTRSADETARIKQVESRIDWSEAGKKGLEVVKTAIEKGSSIGSSSSSSASTSTAFGATTLNVIELEACVRESKWLDDASDTYDVKKRRLDEQNATIDRLSAEIDAARSKINRSSQRSVDAFNARIREHRQQVSYYNDVLLPDVRREQDAFNVRVGQFQKFCNGKRYYDGDLAEVEQKIGFKLSN